MKKYKLHLINPVFSMAGLGQNRGTKMPPLSLAYLAACTPSHYKIKILDEYIAPLSFEPADIVGITSYSSHIVRAYEVAQHYRRSGTPVIMGGIHASMCTEEALDYCDAVVVGEAENMWPRVLEDFEKGTLQKIYRGPHVDLATLPMPRRDLLDEAPYVWATIQTSRGCPMNCSFCSVTQFNGNKFRRRPVEAVLEELQQIKPKNIFFVDDNLLGHGDTEWLNEFFSQIVKLNLKKRFFAQTSIKFGEDKALIRLAAKAGLKLVFVGMESINYDNLKAYNKNLNANYTKANRITELINNIRKGGIAFLGAFILGGDLDRIADFKSTYNFINKANVDVVQISKPTPLPGTRFFDELNNAKRIIKANYPSDWRHYRFSRMVFEPENMSIEDVYHGFYWLKKSFYSLPNKMRRCLRTLIDTKSLSATIISHIMNRSYEKYFRASDIYRKIENDINDYLIFRDRLENRSLLKMSQDSCRTRN